MPWCLLALISIDGESVKVSTRLEKGIPKGQNMPSTMLQSDREVNHMLIKLGCRYTGNTIVANEFNYNVTNQKIYDQGGVQVTSCTLCRYLWILQELHMHQLAFQNSILA